ncbi:SAM-dependent methyltransferase [Nonomuraea thailandensis]
MAARLGAGHVLAIDRSATAIAQARAAAAGEIAAGRMSVRQVAGEDFVLLPGEEPYDLVFAVRVGALDGRRPEAGRRLLDRVALATRAGARLFIDGGDPCGSCRSRGEGRRPEVEERGPRGEGAWRQGMSDG